MHKESQRMYQIGVEDECQLPSVSYIFDGFPYFKWKARRWRSRDQSYLW